MKTPEQLKGAIRNIAYNHNFRAQEVLQMYLFERIIERLAESKYIIISFNNRLFPAAYTAGFFM